MPPSETPTAYITVSAGTRSRIAASIAPNSSWSPEWYARGLRFGSPPQPRKCGTTPRQPRAASAAISARA